MCLQATHPMSRSEHYPILIFPHLHMITSLKYNMFTYALLLCYLHQYFKGESHPKLPTTIWGIYLMTQMFAVKNYSELLQSYILQELRSS